MSTKEVDDFYTFLYHTLDNDISRYSDIVMESASTYVQAKTKGKIEQSKRILELMFKYEQQKHEGN